MLTTRELIFLLEEGVAVRALGNRNRNQQEPVKGEKGRGAPRIFRGWEPG